MNIIDLVIIAVFLIAIIAGWYQGFISGALSLTSWLGAIVLAYLFYPYIAQALKKYFSDIGTWLQPVSFIITFIAARVILGLITSRINRRFGDHAHQSGFNRFLGIIPGTVNGWIISIIISALLLSLPLNDDITEKTRQSKLASPLALQSEWANKKLAPVFDQAVNQTINSLSIDPRSPKKVDLTFQYDNPQVRPFLEGEMLKMVNRERRKAGLKELKADQEMTRVARAHSKDMFVRGYFAHENPDGESPFDRMRRAGVKFYAAGENLALAQTLEIAHTNLMNSPGHRANILNPEFGRLGIGILDGGFYGLMVSQEFRD